jgi:hypothetical protein
MTRRLKGWYHRHLGLGIWFGIDAAIAQVMMVKEVNSVQEEVGGLPGDSEDLASSDAGNRAALLPLLAVQDRVPDSGRCGPRAESRALR